VKLLTDECCFGQSGVNRVHYILLIVGPLDDLRIDDVELFVRRSS
jgi:hypothetical protein